MTILYQDDYKKISVFQDQTDFAQSDYYQNNNWCMCGKSDWTDNLWGTSEKLITALVVEPLAPIRPNECWGLRLQSYWGSIRMECRNESQFGWTSTLDHMLERFPDLHTVSAIHKLARDHSMIRLVLSDQDIQHRWAQILDRIKTNLYSFILQESSQIVVAVTEPLYQFGLEYNESLQQHAGMFILFHINLLKKDFDTISREIFESLTISNIDESTRRNQILTNQVWRPWMEKHSGNRLMSKCQMVFGPQFHIFRELFIMEIGRRISESIEKAKQEIIDEFQLNQ